MKNLIKGITAFIVGITCFTIIFAGYSMSKTDLTKQNIISENNELTEKAAEAKKYCLENNMNTDFCILIDMNMHSGKNRFFVYDLNKDVIVKECLVSHGCGTNGWSLDDSKDSPTFSNVQDSHLSSLGKYKIGERGYSMFGVHTKYLLHGLEKTNSNACKRDVVFHSWSVIDDQETYPAGTPEGWGCPAISDNNFRYVDELLKSQTKSTLMWIYK